MNLLDQPTSVRDFVLSSRLAPPSLHGPVLLPLLVCAVLLVGCSAPTPSVTTATVFKVPESLATTAPDQVAPRVAYWPAPYQAAVSLAYDDALPSQLAHAVPQLNQYQIKATFYLTLAQPGFRQQQAKWQQLAAQGHELANHSFSHPCRASLPGRQWVTAAQDLDQWTMAQMQQELLQANQQLQQLDGERVRTFTPPCGDQLLKDGNYLNKLQSMFLAVRLPGPPITALAQLQQQRVPTWFPVDPSLQQLIAYVEAAAAHGTLASITFHGVGGDHLAVASDVHQQFLAYLAANRQRFWLANFREISGYLQQNPVK